MGNRLDGKICVVTGAARGIGQGCAVELARGGGRVVVSDLHPEGGQETLARIAALGGEAIYIPCDVRRREDIEALMRAAADHFGGIDVVHNNAGIHETSLTDKTAIYELPEDIWEQIYEVNLRSMWYSIRASLPYLKQSAAPSIINSASVSSFMSMPMSSAYCTSKGAVLMLTRSAAVDLAPFNIRVNCICPGPIDTPPVQKFFTMLEDPVEREALRKSLLGANLIPRLGTPEEVGKLVCFLASDDSSYMTGGHYFIDAGVMAWRGSRA